MIDVVAQTEGEEMPRTRGVQVGPAGPLDWRLDQPLLGRHSLAARQ